MTDTQKAVLEALLKEAKAKKIADKAQWVTTHFKLYLSTINTATARKDVEKLVTTAIREKQTHRKAVKVPANFEEGSSTLENTDHLD